MRDLQNGNLLLSDGREVSRNCFEGYLLDGYSLQCLREGRRGNKLLVEKNAEDYYVESALEM